MFTKKNMTLLGKLLVQKGLITIDQLEAGLRHQKKTGQFIGSTLVNLGFLREEQLMPVVAQQLEVKYVRLEDIKIDTNVIEKVPAKFACHFKLMPMSFKNNLLTIAVSNPMNINMLDDLKLLLNFDVEFVLAGESDILEAIKKYYGIGAETIEKMIGQSKHTHDISALPSMTEDIQDMAEDASIVKFVNQIFLEALSAWQLFHA